MQVRKIVVPFLSFGNEEINSPIGLSEILEKTWVKKIDDEPNNEVVNHFSRSIYKSSNGRWATKFVTIT